MVVYAVHVGLNFTESGENLSRLVRLALDLIQQCLLQINELKVQYSSCYRSRYTEPTLDSSYPVPDASRDGGWKAADLKVS